MKAPAQIGRYKIEERLGAGANAEVYKATDTVLHRPVALKILNPKLIADEQAYARFIQEAQVAANIYHPHIATVIDLGETDGYYYLAMRYVEGLSLDKVIASGPLPWAQALSITSQVADALEFAHQKGLVHRDVKPQNIILSEREGAVLTDFGLVKALQSSSMTSTGAMLGTPQYMAPETWLGQPVSAATDQYALACVLFEMLTGGNLFQAPTPPAVMNRHFQPRQLPRLWPEGTPSQLSTILTRALDQEPAKRYASIADFVSTLKTAGASAPASKGIAAKRAQGVSSRTPGETSPPPPPSESHRPILTPWMIGGGVVLIVFLSLLVGWLARGGLTAPQIPAPTSIPYSSVTLLAPTASAMPSPNFTSTPSEPAKTATASPIPTFMPGILEISYGDKEQFPYPPKYFGFRGIKGDHVTIAVLVSPHPWGGWEAQYCNNSPSENSTVTLALKTSQPDANPVYASGRTSVSISDFELPYTGIYYLDVTGADATSGGHGVSSCDDWDLSLQKK